MHWHSLTALEALKRLGTTEAGLAADEVARRVAIHGRNVLETRQRPSILRRLLAQLDNLLIYVLLGSAAITAALGEWVDTGVIVGVVVINALIGLVQEGKAEAALHAIRGMLAPLAVVNRDGRRHEIPAESLVPGDIVLLRAGDRVPADLRVLQAHGLQAQEAALTGEPEPADKLAGPVEVDAPLGDRRSMLYAGTLVTCGSGRGLVVATAKATEIGRITSLLDEVETLTTPLLRQMAVFGRWLTIGTLILAGGALLFGWLLRGYRLGDMFLAAVSLAVAAIPEGLPAIMTITLAIGVARMARRNAIIRRLPAVETLGALTIICSDKTGTLTLNEMTVQRVVTAGTVYEIQGSGYAPVGAIRREGASVDLADAPDLLAVARAGVLCNDGDIAEQDSAWAVAGNPTDGALLALGGKAGLERKALQAKWPRRDVIPFDSEHKFQATLHAAPARYALIVVKGAPERIVEMCAMQAEAHGDRPIDPAYWLGRTGELAAAAMRVLAIARRKAPASTTSLGFADVEGRLTMLGLVGLMDPPRPEARAAVAECQAAGIRVKMITGDHVATATAIGEQVGLDGSGAVTGLELDAMDAVALRAVASEVDVFARTTPEHKLRLVEVLQAQGHVVAMTGDGVNDAPALKRADVGIAMGRKGTEAAKEAAQMVLADDRFVSIAQAVEEGRTVYDNLMKTILFALPTNGAQALCILTAILLGQTLPITPLQVLWVNMVSAVTLGMALAFEPGEPDLMQRRPRRADAPILSPFVVWRVLFVSLLLLVACFGLFEMARARGAELATARTLAVNALVAGEIAYLVSVRQVHGSALAWPQHRIGRAVPLSIVAVAALQLAFTYLPWMQRLFATAPVNAAGWAWITVITLAVFVCLELEKHLLSWAGAAPKPA